MGKDLLVGALVILDRLPHLVNLSVNRLQLLLTMVQLLLALGLVASVNILKLSIVLTYVVNS